MNSLFPFVDKVEYLRQVDGRMAQLIERFGYLERPTNQPLFATLVRNIVSQQIATSVAERSYAALVQRVGEVTPQTIVALGFEGLRTLSLPERKARWIVAAAERFEAGEFELERLQEMDDCTLLGHLTSLNGVGRWSAEMLMMFSLSRDNVLSSGDLILKRAIATLYGEKRLTPKRFERYVRLFSPFGSVASLYLWAYGNSLPKRQAEVTIRPLGFARAKDKTVCYGFYDTPYGTMLIASSHKGVCRVAFADDREEALDELRAELKGAKLQEQSDPSHKQMLRLLQGRSSENITLYLEGTSFERKVWRELLRIPYGITVSYADVAAGTGFTKAYRSVGNAVGANPIAVIIPCHRVIHADGTLGDYNAGIEKKLALVGEEKRRVIKQ